MLEGWTPDGRVTLAAKNRPATYKIKSEHEREGRMTFPLWADGDHFEASGTR
jgi:hypothetical protein